MPFELKDLEASVAGANIKVFGDAPATLLVQALAHHQNTSLAQSTQYNKTAARVDAIAEAALGATIAGIQKFSYTEGLAMRQVDPASGQVAVKGAQTAPPVTA
jgi:hypothetical protein